MQNTRQLSLTSNLDLNNTSEPPANETVNQSLLLYENSLGNVSALLKIRQRCPSEASDCVVEGSDGSPAILSWLDISKNNKSVPQSVFSPVYYNSGGQLFDGQDDQVVSSTLYGLSTAESMLSTPFAGVISYPVVDSGPQIQLLICSNSQPVGKAETPRRNFMSLAYTSWSNSSHGAFATASMYPKSSNSALK